MAVRGGDCCGSSSALGEIRLNSAEGIAGEDQANVG
jgi:hypothetical protein